MLLVVRNSQNQNDKIPLKIEDDRWFITHKWNGVDELEFEMRSNDPDYKYVIEESVIEANDEGGNLFLVKNIDEHSDFITVSCEVDLDDWRKSFWKSYKKTNATLLDVLNEIKPEGWSVDFYHPFVKRTHMSYEDGSPFELVTAYDLLEEASKAYGCQFRFGVFEKRLVVVDATKFEPSGQFLTDELNLRSVGYVGNSSQFRTRLYAFGKVDEQTGQALTFESINDGKAYVEDYTYSDKIVSIGWSDDRYTVPENLLEDAKKKLEELSKPKRSYSCEVVNIPTDDEMYLYKVVSLIDRRRAKAVEHQVVEYKKYPRRPDLDVVTLSTTEPTIGLTMRKIQETIAKKSSQQMIDIQSVIDAAISDATQLITGNKGGNFVWVFDNEGRPIELLNLGDSLNPNEAQKVWRWNASGLGHSNQGINGPYDLALLADGSINASMMTTGTLNAGIIKAGVISDVLGNNSWDLENGIFRFSASSQVGETTLGDMASNIGSLQSELQLTKEAMTLGFQQTDQSIQNVSDSVVTISNDQKALKATYATCSTSASTAAKVATCSDFVLRKGAQVSVKFTYKNSVVNPTLDVNGTGAKAMKLNGTALPEDAWWLAGQIVTFIYDGTDWQLQDGSVAAQTVTNKQEVSSLKVTAQELTASVASHTTSITQLKATYATCETEADVQTKVATCADFSLRLGAIVTVKFTNENTASSPRLNVNSTGAKYIRSSTSSWSSSNNWKAGESMTFIYDGTYWQVIDGSTLTRLATTESTVSTLSVKADSIETSVKGLQARYGTCSTAADVQTKEVTIANFTKIPGATVTVKFSYANTASSPKLSVKNTDGSVVATGSIYVNGSIMSSYHYWNANGTLTFVWDGTYWRLGDGETMSQIKQLRDSITLSVSNASLGSNASITLSANGNEVTKNIDLSKVRQAFRDDTSAITISAGTVTFNSNTFVVNSTYFSVSSDGKITATSGLIGGFTLANGKIYTNNRTTSNSITTGTTISPTSTDGISTANGTYWCRMASGYVDGGIQSSTSRGKIHFAIQFRTAPDAETYYYGTQIFGSGMICLNAPRLSVVPTSSSAGGQTYYLAATRSCVSLSSTTKLSVSTKTITKLSRTDGSSYSSVAYVSSVSLVKDYVNQSFKLGLLMD